MLDGKIVNVVEATKVPRICGPDIGNAEAQQPISFPVLPVQPSLHRFKMGSVLTRKKYNFCDRVEYQNFNSLSVFC